jgi:hypothetical protein
MTVLFFVFFRKNKGIVGSTRKQNGVWVIRSWLGVGVFKPSGYNHFKTANHLKPVTAYNR